MRALEVARDAQTDLKAARALAMAAALASRGLVEQLATSIDPRPEHTSQTALSDATFPAAPIDKAA